MAKRNLQKYLESSGMMGKLSDAEVPMLEALVSGVNIDRIADTYLKAVSSQIAARASTSSTVSKLMSNRSIIHNAPSWGPGLVSAPKTSKAMHYESIDLNAAGRVRSMQARNALIESRRAMFDRLLGTVYDENGNFLPFYGELGVDPRLPTSVGNVGTAKRSTVKEKKIGGVLGAINATRSAHSNILKSIYGKSIASITDESLDKRPDAYSVWKQEGQQWLSFSGGLNDVVSGRRRPAVARKFEAIRRGRAIEEEAREAERLFRFDQMDEEGQERERLRERYKGAIDRDYKVSKAMDKKEREKYLKVLPKMFKESQLSTKTLGRIAKFYDASGGLSVAKKIKGLGSIGAGAAVAGGVMALVGNLYERELKADKRIVGLQTTRGMYGSLRDKSGNITGTGILAMASGLDEQAATKSWGGFNAQWAGQGMLGLRAFQEVSKNAPQWMIPLLAKEFGMDENLVSMAQNMDKSFKDLTPEQQKVIAAELSQRQRDEMSSSSASIGEQIQSWATDFSFGRAVATHYAQENLMSSVPASVRNAAISADNYSASNAITGGGTTYGNNTFTIGTANFTGPNVRSMAEDIATQSGVDSNQKQNILKSFDGGQ